MFLRFKKSFKEWHEFFRNVLSQGFLNFFFSTTLRKYEFANTGGKFLFAINGGKFMAISFRDFVKRLN